MRKLSKTVAFRACNSFDVNLHTRTPFCLSGFKIAYIGAIDDNKNEEKVVNKYVESALTSILAKDEIKVKTTIAKGCTISYKK